MDGPEKMATHTFQLQVMSKSKMSTDKNTSEEEMVNLLEDEEEEEVVDSGDRVVLNFK